MLSYLQIRNLVLVEDLALELSPGMNVLTGETGAGKSIILGALSLLRGSKGRGEWVRSGCDAASVEAQFDLGDALRARVALLLGEYGVNWDGAEELVVQRTLPRSGRGRILVQAQLTPRTTLETVGEELIDLCSQHEHHSLTRVARHAELLDEAGRLQGPLADYQCKYQRFRELQGELLKLQERLAGAGREREFLAFQEAELQRLAPEPGELEELLERAASLRNAEEHARLLQLCETELMEGDGAVLPRLRSLAALLRRARRGSGDDTSKAFDATLEALATAEGACEEALRGLQRGTKEDPAEALEALEGRISEYKRLARKHQLAPEQLADHHRQLQATLDELGTLAEREVGVREALLAQRHQAEESALRLRTARRDAGGKLARALRKELRSLHLADARLEVELRPSDDLGPRGLDQVEFLFSANPGEPLAPLTKVASGGELSRVLLALKTVLSSNNPVTTFVFDEVDAGVGGAVADAIGQRLAAIAQSNQVLVVTHLPQIAALAQCHFHVTKVQREGRTVTEVRPLSRSERIDELARMLGGSLVTDSARQHAEELLRLAGH